MRQALRPPRRRPIRRGRLECEGLEDRIAPATTVQFQATSSTVMEQPGTPTYAAIVVVLNAATSQTVTVNVSTGQGSAKPGTDYTPVSTTATFAPGQTTQTISVPVLGDPQADGTVYMPLALSNPTGATLGPNTGTILSLQDPSQPPVAQNQSFSVAANGTLSVPAPGLLTNAGDPSGQPLTVASINGHAVTFGAPITLPSGATLTVASDSSFKYVPRAGFTGSDGFSFTLTDGTSTSNTATAAISVISPVPVAQDQSFSVVQNGTLSVSAPGLLTNASDPSGKPLTVATINGNPVTFGSPITLPSGATLTVASDGSFDYAPPAGFTGNDGFSFTLTDGTSTSNTAGVAINVAASQLSTWTGAGPDSLASDPLNWSGDVLPGPRSTLVFDGTSSKSCVMDAGFGSQVGSVQVTSAYQGSLTIANNLTVSGAFQNDGQVAVQGGAVLTLNGGGSGAGSFNVDSASTLAFAGGTFTANPGLAFLGAGQVIVGGAGQPALNVAAGATVTAPADGTLAAGGTIGGAGNFNIGGAFTWSGGTMTGTGTTQVQAGGNLTLAGGNLTLNQRGLTVAAGGTATMTAGQLTVANGATISNNGSFNLQGNNLAIQAGAGGAGPFINAGTFTKSQSLASDTTQVGLAFTNAGKLQAQTGILAFPTELTSNGLLNISAGAEVRGPNLTMFSGTVQADGTLHVTGGGQLFWGTASLLGAGSVVSDPGTTLAIPSGLKDTGVTISNSGVLLWTGGDITLNSGATLKNQPNATVQVRCDNNINSTAGTGAVINYGTFSKLVGAANASTNIQVPFSSLTLQGQPPSKVDAQAGTINIQQGGTYQANLNAAAGANIYLGSASAPQTYLMQNGSTITGAGNVVLTFSGIMQIADAATVTCSGNFFIGSGLGFLIGLPNGTLSGSQGKFINTGTVTWGYGAIQNLMLFDNQATLKIARGDPASAVVLDSSLLQNDGTATWTLNNIQMTSSNPLAKSEILNYGRFDVQTDASLFSDQANPPRDFINEPNAIFTKSAGNGVNTIEVPFTTSGQVDLMGHAMSFTGSFNQNAGTVKLSNGGLSANAYSFFAGTVDLGTNGNGSLVVPAGLSIPNGATLTGIGIVTGSVTNSGSVNLGQGGAPVGQLTISGNYTQTDNGRLVLRLTAARNLQYDRLDVTNTADLGGTLQVMAWQNFAPAQGDLFNLLTFGQESNDFVRPYGLPTLPQGRSWGIMFTPNQLQITVQ